MNALRDALAALPRAANVKPGETVSIDDVYVIFEHRNVIDLKRPLVVANRGMGKSLWAHALRDRAAWHALATRFQMPEHPELEARLAFHGGLATTDGAVTREMLSSALTAGFDAKEIFHGVLLRQLAPRLPGNRLPEKLLELLAWQRENAEDAANLRTAADEGLPLLLLFDGLDRLGRDWTETQALLKGLLQVALEVQSLRSVFFKIFLRNDQFEDLRIFEFPDSSKLRSARAELKWPSRKLYGLLFFHLERVSSEAAAVLKDLDHEARVNALAGPYMGADHRRGHVFSWVPTHLADTRGEISPRTFLTAWRCAAEHARDREPEKVPTLPVDPKAIHAGVQKASEDRMDELREDYPWVDDALKPLAGLAVPFPLAALDSAWNEAGTFAAVSKREIDADRPIWVAFVATQRGDTNQLVDALEWIGVAERRKTADGEKINIPDIFRVNAGIKRRGGVVPKTSE